MHTPVLKEEALKILNPLPGDNFVDATVDGGGYTFDILDRTYPRGKVLGIDFTPEMIEILQENIRKKGKDYKNRIIAVCGNFSNIDDILKEEKFKDVKGIIFDLGVSSYHFEDIPRGFSFNRKSDPLDMRYNPYEQNITAADILNKFSLQEIERIIKDFGEERNYKKIAKAIIARRKVKKFSKVRDLTDILGNEIGKRYKDKIHFATRTFQALRIAVNDELNSLKKGIEKSIDLIERGGKVVVVSFHSLEDRIVKNIFRDFDKSGTVRIITKKPITPSSREIFINRACRSAKLRAIEKI